DFGNFSFRIQLPSSMKQRGIHDVFHASLLRIHHPNDDRLFPGRLDEQVVEPEQHPTEWAADKIISHSGSKASALFEVLWKSGDKTWLMKSQVEDLELLQPYMDAIGIDSIGNLPVGTGKPPTNDPQVFSGSLIIEKIFEGINTSQVEPGLSETTSTLACSTCAPHTVSHCFMSRKRKGKQRARSSSPSSSGSDSGSEGEEPRRRLDSRRPQNHYQCPNNLDLNRNDGQVGIRASNQTTFEHLTAGQYLAYRKFDSGLQENPMYWQSNDKPAGYDNFADKFNSNHRYPCKFATWDLVNRRYNTSLPSIPSTALLPSNAVNPELARLVTFGILNADGTINEKMWASVMAAILRPHVEANRFRERGEEKRRKKDLQRAREKDRVSAAQLKASR
ncbi:hypothetical protein H0H93_013997, partial [Arthromyces matolae]